MATPVDDEWEYSPPQTAQAVDDEWEYAPPQVAAPTQSRIDNATRGFNTGLAGAVGFPVDAVNSALGSFGVPVSDAPVGGSQFFKGLMDKAGTLAPEANDSTGRAIQKIGEYAGAGAAFGPSAILPGAVAGMGAATAREIAPDSDISELGGALATGVGAPMAASKLGNMARNKIATRAADKTANTVRDATLADSRKAGYQVPPSEADATVTSNLLERWAGKASVAQQASLNNQKVTNRLIQETLGLKPNQPVTKEALLPLKQAAWGVYEKVKSVGSLSADKNYADTLSGIRKQFNGLANEFPELANTGIDDLVTALNKPTISAEGAVEAIKNLRYQAKTNLNPVNTNPAARSLGKAQKEAADALEGLIERNLDPDTLGGLVKDFRNARATLAQVGTVERVLAEATGDVSARKLAAELAKGRPLTGGLRKAAEFAQAFPRYAQQNVNPVPGGSPLDAALSIGATAATSNPAWLAMIAGRPLARKAVLSDVFAGAPNYNTGPVTKLLSKMPQRQRRLSDLSFAAPYFAEE